MSTRSKQKKSPTPQTLGIGPQTLKNFRLEIFERLASGRSNHDIARELSLSTNTVHNHIASILAKLHLDNRIQAAVQAVRSGIS